MGSIYSIAYLIKCIRDTGPTPLAGGILVVYPIIVPWDRVHKLLAPQTLLQNEHNNPSKILVTTLMWGLNLKII